MSFLDIRTLSACHIWAHHLPPASIFLWHMGALYCTRARHLLYPGTPSTAASIFHIFPISFTPQPVHHNYNQPLNHHYYCSPSTIAIHSSMELDLHDKIIEQFKLLQQEWTQTLCLPHGNRSIDLMCACGPEACTPTNAIKQLYDYPRRTAYRFDKKFKAESSRTAICQLNEECTPGAKYIYVRGQNARNCIEYHCSYNMTTESLEKRIL